MTVWVSTIWRGSQGGRHCDKPVVRVRSSSTGLQREKVAPRDKRCREQFIAKMVLQLERIEAGLEKPEHPGQKKPIEEHVAEFGKAMAAGVASYGGSGKRRRRGRPDPEWVRRSMKRLTEIAAGLSWKRLADLVANDAARWLQRQMWADKTKDDRTALLRQFGRWLLDEGLVDNDPFAKLRVDASTEASKTFHRTRVSLQELGQVIAAAEQRPLQRLAGMPHQEKYASIGRERGHCIRLGAYSGLRRKEITRIEWGDLDLGEKPAVHVRAAITKNKRAKRVEIPRHVAEDLEQHRRELAAAFGRPVRENERVFPRTSYRHLLERLKDDLEFAGLGRRDERDRIVDEAGLVIDFHGLRVTFTSLLVEHGATPAETQQLARHEDPRTTFKIYTRVPNGALRRAVDRLPAPPEEPPKTLRPLMAPSAGLSRQETKQA